MSNERQACDDQAQLWNGPAGRAWIEAQDILDGMFQPFEERLVQAMPAASGGWVLDVGCGTGSTTLALARRLGPQRRAVGIDLSAPMLALAQKRAEQEGVPAEFIRADAQTYAFEPDRFDWIVSRFGIMFFGDPVRAFANLRYSAKAGAELCCIAWRSAAENPFMTTAEQAAAPLLPQLPVRQPGSPGQFAFADSTRVQTILEESGWASIDIRPIDVACVLPERDLLRYVSWLGPVGAVLQQMDEPTRRSVVDSVRRAFEPFVVGAEVRFTAGCWLVGARAT